jgi:hypothetical protein
MMVDTLEGVMLTSALFICFRVGCWPKYELESEVQNGSNKEDQEIIGEKPTYSF